MVNKRERRWSTGNVALTEPQEQPGMPVSLDTWKRIMQRVKDCKVSLRLWSVAYSVAFAVGITAGLSIIPLAYAQLPWWILTVYISLCALGIGVGVVLIIAERILARNQQSQVDSLIADMQQVMAPFVSSESEGLSGGG